MQSYDGLNGIIWFKFGGADVHVPAVRNLHFWNRSCCRFRARPILSNRCPRRSTRRRSSVLKNCLRAKDKGSTLRRLAAKLQRHYTVGSSLTNKHWAKQEIPSRYKHSRLLRAFV